MPPLRDCTDGLSTAIRRSLCLTLDGIPKAFKKPSSILGAGEELLSCIATGGAAVNSTLTLQP